MTVSFRFTCNRKAFQLQIAASLNTQVTGVFGPSGAGKSTLLHLIAGIEKPDHGELTLNGQVLMNDRIHVPVHQRKMGVVFQDGRLFPHLTVTQNLRYGMAGDFSFQEIVSLLELESLLTKRPIALSGGERQRVALGRALLRSPDLLLLDEPMAALDRGLKRQILPFLRRVKQETQIPMIHVSHDLGEILQLTDQLLVLRDGKAVGQGSFLELVRNQEVRELFHDLGLLNVLPLTVASHKEEEGITLFHPEGQEQETWVGPQHPSPPGSKIFTALRPEDIALVDRPVSNISIRNQIPGVIEDLIISDHKALCILNTGPKSLGETSERTRPGVKLLAELTPNAIHGMGLEKGQEIWCMFKAHALNYLD